MKKLTLLCTLLLSCAGMMAQRDSLFQVVRSLPDDTLKVQQLLDLGMEYEMSQPDSAILIYNMARDLSNKLNYPVGYCRYANAVAYPLELYSRLDEKDSILRVAIGLCEKHGFKRELARKYHSLGISEQMRRDYDGAIDLYLKGLTIIEELKDTALLTAFYNNLGSVFKGMGQNEKAYQYIEKALNIHRARGRKSGIATAQINLGILDGRNLEYDKALQRYNEALTISEELQDMEGIIICNVNMADIYLGQKKIKEALDCIAIGDSVARALESPIYILLSAQAKASALKQQGKIEESIEAFKEAEKLALELGEKERLSAIYLDQADNYEKVRDYENALKHFKLYHAYDDSVRGEGIENNINELEIKYNTAKKERELLAKDLEIEREKSRTNFRGSLLIISLIVILALALFFILRQRLNKQKLLNMERVAQLEKLELKEKERSRIAADMHDDLGSGLTSIRLLSEIALRKSHERENIHELERISVKSNELVHKMSEIIWAMNPSNDTVVNLVAYIRAYSAQFLDEAEMQLSFKENIPTSSLPVSGESRRSIFLVVKEALNNAVKYSKGTKVDITISSDGKSLRGAIADNGTGIDEAQMRTGSQGLSSMKKRIESLGGNFSIHNQEGTMIEFEIPLNYT